MDTDGTGDNGHAVLSECPCLVGANDRSVSHGLTRAKDAYQEVFSGHPVLAKAGASERPSGTATTTRVTEMVKKV